MSLRTDSLVKAYGGRRVVDEVSIAVEPGEVVGLLGPNGAGKTTTFYMVIGLVRRDGGDVFLGDQNIGRLPMHKRCRLGIGYLAQEPSVFRKLTVRDNLNLVLEAQGIGGKGRKARADELMEKIGISHLAGTRAAVLSGGERRRVEIARTLCSNPSFILLDEPFTGIDPIAIEDIQGIVRSLTAEGIGILITDHNVRETLEITDRAYILFDGVVRTQGRSADIPNDPIAKKYYLGERFSAANGQWVASEDATGAPPDAD
ncbi:MAG TPA: LPS export ABC transporter ATP-binding protein [Armatimonadota bacterium]|nr:LPS export ABC transporter ATP-binding protein [Armatimonadota bacterium]